MHEKVVSVVREAAMARSAPPSSLREQPILFRNDANSRALAAQTEHTDHTSDTAGAVR
jgi:pyrroloquinoline quinone biosynthesis protein E